MTPLIGAAAVHKRARGYLAANMFVPMIATQRTLILLSDEAYSRAFIYVAAIIL